MKNSIYLIEEKRLDNAFENIKTCYPEFRPVYLKSLFEFVNSSIAFKNLCISWGEQRNSFVKKCDYKTIYNLNYVDLVKKFRFQYIDLLPIEKVIVNYFLWEEYSGSVLYVSDRRELLQNYFTWIAKLFSPKQEGFAEDKAFDIFIKHVLEPIIWELKFQTSHEFILKGIIEKFKLQSEWFNRDKLNQLIESDSSRAEHLLTSALYSYLFDHDVDLKIEPLRENGRIDFIASQEKSSEKVFAECKVFRDSNTLKELKKAINQLRTYLRQYNEQEGYLIIFNIQKSKLEFRLNGFYKSYSVLEIDNRKIWLLEIDLYPERESPSKENSDIIVIENGDLISNN